VLNCVFEKRLFIECDVRNGNAISFFLGSMGGSMFRVSVGSGNEVLPEDINITFKDVKGVPLFLIRRLVNL